jgi:hypothetical protein
MQTTRIALLSGVAAMALVGLAGAAEAGSPETHVVTLRLPNGQVEQVRYVGDVPPTVVLAPDATASFAAPVDPFAMFAQISAAMDRQEAAMLRTINALADPSGSGFGMIPVLSGPGVCAHSVQISFMGNGQSPRVVSHTSGDCGPVHDKAAPVMLPNAPAAKPAPDIVQAKASKPYPALVQQAGDWQVADREH